jgi:hypothetical protein
MMGRRGLLLLGTAAAASLGAAFWSDPAREEAGRLPTGSLAFPGLAAQLAGARRIEIARPDGRTTLLRDGEGWRIAELDGYPAVTARVRALLTALTELRLVEERVSDPAMQARLGLDDGAVAVTVLDAGGQPLAALRIGRQRVRAQGNLAPSLYVRRGGEARAWLAEGRLAADTDPRLWVERDLAVLAPARLRRVEVARLGEPPLVLARAGEVDAALLVVTPDDAPPTDVLARDEIGRAFDMLTFQEVRRGAALPGEALGTARFAYTDEVTITVTGSREGEGFWVRLEASGGPEAQALDARWRGWIYELGGFKEKAMLPRLADLAPP